LSVVFLPTAQPLPFSHSIYSWQLEINDISERQVEIDLDQFFCN